MALYSGNSVVDYLKSIGGDSSYTARAKKAASLGIKGYSGTAQQNSQMLNMLRSPAKPATPVVAAAPVKPVTQATTVPVPSAVDSDAADRAAARQIRDSMTGASSTSSSSPSAATTALDNINPTRKSINDLVQSLIGGLKAAPYNPSTDTDFQAAKADLEKQADRSYDNTMAGYLGNQSGNFNSAALQVASGAKNDLLGKIPLLQGEYEDRYNTQQRQKQSDTLGLVNTLLGIENTDYNRQQTETDKTRKNYIDTIDQYYDDYDAEIKRLEASNDADKEWKIPLLRSARVNKLQAIAEQKAADTAAADKAAQQEWDNAMKLWEQSGTVTSQKQANILGVPVGAKTADYNIDNINAATSARNASTSAYNAVTSRMNAETSKNKAEEKPLFDGEDYYKTAYDMQNELVDAPDPSGEFGTTIKAPKYTDSEIIDYVMNSGLDSDTVGQILTRLRYTDSDVETYLSAKEKAHHHVMNQGN